MPRETIFVPTNGDPADVPHPFQIKVGWQPDCDVQVGLATHDDRHLVDYIYANEVATIGDAVRRELTLGENYSRYTDEQIGRVVLDAVTGSTVFGTSVWAHPGRQQINQLILLLRKARDSAFGKDA